ncbi:MAG TPA: S8 family serine peptidase [Pseudolabrys sp.]|jgi:subtilisin family serine protease
MRAYRSALLCFAAVAALTIAADAASAQKVFSRGVSSNVSIKGPTRGVTPRVNATGPSRGGFRGGRNFGGGYRGWGGPGILSVIPPGGRQYVDDPGDVPPGANQGPQRSAQRNTSGAASANGRYVPNEVVLAVSNTVSPAQIDALQTRFRLTRLESQTFQLSGTTLYRWRVPSGISVPRAVQALQGDARVTSVQPNYLFTMQQGEPAAPQEGDAAQYELAKLHLPQAHTLAKGDKILIAVIDSGVDVNHPDLAGAITETYDTLGQPFTPHKHGTAIAGLIAAHGRLMGAAPGARILAIRAFNPTDKGADGTTFNILKGLDWAAAHDARIINMSFAGPADPAIHHSLEAARKKGIVLIAAVGNAGAKSPPLYPAADPNVIAVTATDADDRLFEQSSRGPHVALAAPGAQILVAIPDGAYEVSSGTSYSAAEVSGIVALMLERKGDLTPDNVRDILMATAKDLGPKGRDPLFGAGLADAYGALMLEQAPVTASAPPGIERVSAGAR